MMNLVDQPYFFIEAVVSLVIDRAVGLAFDGTVLIKTDVDISFSRLFL